MVVLAREHGGVVVAAEATRGVAFPRSGSGERRTSTVGRAVVAEALATVDPPGARAAERETNWRSGYIKHLRRATEAGLASREAALSIARDGLTAVHGRMVVADGDGTDQPLEVLRSAPAARRLTTHRVEGMAEPRRHLAIPYRGSWLEGDALRRQLDRWATDGVIEPTVLDAVERVLANPDWLAFREHTVVVLGAGAELGPLRPLLRWGATVAGIDLPRPGIWERILDTARGGAGTLLVPVPDDGVTEVSGLERRVGLDLTGEVPAAADWIGALPGTPVLGNYAYADGGAHVRVTVAVDALTARVQGIRDDLALAFLATPTDVFAVPEAAVDQAVEAYEQRSTAAKVVGRPLRAVSGGRLLRRNYAPGVGPGICDALVAQQGPNYALAKRLQRWRAAVARDEGTTVSLNVAPSTRTRSVVKNRVLAAAYAGAHRFGIEIFEPETSNALMAALLAHDLHTAGGPNHEHPWQDEAWAAAHGGLWRAAYAPRSALGLATVLGLGAARS
jgi:hypothetical protein